MAIIAFDFLKELRFGRAGIIEELRQSLVKQVMNFVEIWIRQTGIDDVSLIRHMAPLYRQV
jgi:hypothetical protein